MGSSAPIKLLIANDDGWGALTSWKEAIEGLGLNIQIFTVRDIAQATEIFNQENPQLVISDLRIPPRNLDLSDDGVVAHAADFARNCKQAGATVVVASNWDNSHASAGLERIHADREDVTAWVKDRYRRIQAPAVKLLVVNDNPLVRQFIQGVLKQLRLNIQVLEAENIETAKSIFTKETPQMVISDLQISPGKERTDVAADYSYYAADFARECKEKGAHVVVVSDGDYSNAATKSDRLSPGDYQAIQRWISAKYREITTGLPSSRIDQTNEIRAREAEARKRIYDAKSGEKARQEGHDHGDGYWKR